MAIVKATYTKSRAGAKATIRYLQHRPGKEGERVTRALFGSDGVLEREQAYRMMDDARRGTVFFRIVLSPDPKREDRERDLDLWAITTNTMQALEERLKQEVQWVAVEHSDHTTVRHIHAVVLIRGKLSKADFQALRQAATAAALFQRHERDLALGYQRPRGDRFTPQHVSRAAHGNSWEPQVKPLITYKACSTCGVIQALSRREAQRCSSCGARLSRQGSSAGYEEAQWS